MKRFFLLLSAFFFASALVAQDCSELFFSEYIEGSRNNKALEVYNPTANTIDLSEYVVKRYSNGQTTGPSELSLYGSLLEHDVAVIVNGQDDSVWVSTYWSEPVNDTLAALADIRCSGEYPTPMYFNGNDALVLEHSGAIVDIFAYVGGGDPGANGWNDDPTTNYLAGDDYWTSWTKDRGLIRKPTVMQGVTQNPSAGQWDVSAEWDTVPGNEDHPYGQDIWDNLGTHECNCYSQSVNQIQKQIKMVFYPNPVTNSRFIILATEKVNHIEIFNTAGQAVYTNALENADDEVPVTLESCPPGIYLVNVQFANGKKASQKLLVK